MQSVFRQIMPIKKWHIGVLVLGGEHIYAEKTPHLYLCIAPTVEHCFTDIEMMRGKSSMSAKGAEP